MRSRLRIVFALLTLPMTLVQVACAGGINMDYQAEVDDLLREGRRQETVETILAAGEDVYGERNRLLFHMDLGQALQLAGEYEKSARQFELADSLGSDLYTRSLSNEAASLVSSDLTIPYSGEDFERILVNVFNALNYAFLGKPEDSLVEVRRLASKFEALRLRGAGRYAADPFALYLGGMFYENAGEEDNALISYRKAWKYYRAQEEAIKTSSPRSLARDVVRLSRRLGVEPEEDAAMLAGDGGMGGEGEVVVLHYFGPGPRKTERVVEVSLGRGLVHAYAMDVKSEEQDNMRKALSVGKGMVSTTQITIAYPVFEQPPLAARRAWVESPLCGEADGVLVEDVSTIARLNLEDRMERQWPKIVGRAVLKFLSARAAGEVGKQVSGNEGIGLLVQLLAQGAMSASEAADTRGWRTMPAQIHMSRLSCPEGNHAVRISHSGGVAGGEFLVENVGVSNGKKTIVWAASM